MGFSEWSIGKKIAIIAIIIVIIGVIAFAAVSLLGLTDPTSVSISQGDYKVKIETTGNWASYITTDSKYSQDNGTGDKTIDLGTVNSLSSITVNQMGSGNMKVSILDSSGNVVTERTTSIDYGSIYLLLKV
ncbi:MAG: hypothetical protein FWE58_03855 [Methanobrevibacter sp.]|nr:hypothetical protein [Methanobrevibacter sp.]